MTEHPTRQEILEKYRDTIDASDFEILTTKELPPPAQLQQEGAWIQYLGRLKGAYLYLKRSLYGPVVVIVTIGGFIQGIECIDKYSRVAYDRVQQVVRWASEHQSQPASKYVFAIRDIKKWDAQVTFQLPSEPLLLPTTTTTTSTTTTQPPKVRSYDLPVGSGLIPYSDRWPHLT